VARLRRYARILLGLSWAAGVVVAFGFALMYEATPGEPAAPPATWPHAAPFRLASAGDTLLLFVHPHCPCSRATIGELDRLVAVSGATLHCHVFFYADPALGPGWERTDLWNAAARIPGVEVSADPLAGIARSFGVRTSGQALLYAPDGTLRFAGGITSGRGHAGDNAGADAIARSVRDDLLEVTRTPTFGCPLIESAPTKDCRPQ